MGAKATNTGRQPNVTRRFYIAGAIIYVLAIGIYLVAGLPFELFGSDAPLGIVLTLVIAAQYHWNINSRDTFQRNQESLDALPMTFGAFFLGPAWFVVMVCVGSQIAWSFAAENTPRLRWLNGSGMALVAVCCALVFWWIAPSGPLDSPEALLAVLGMWAVMETVRFVMVIVFVRARYASWKSPHIGGRLRGIPIRGVPVVPGWLLAVSFVGAHWMLPVVAYAIGLMYYLLYQTNRSSALESMMSWFWEFFVRIDTADEPDEVELALNDAFQQFAVLTTYGVAVVDDGDDVSWTGDVATAVLEGVSSASHLEVLAETVPMPNPFWAGTLWAWPIDRVRRSYLVATGVMGAWGIADVTKTGGYLVESARLAIDTMMRRRGFAATAAAEHRRARTDEVTGLLNELGCIEQVDELLRSRPDEQVVVLQASIVGFQHTVDVLGAETGEDLLVGFARRLERIARNAPAVQLVGRGADDTFLLIAVGYQIPVDDLASEISAPSGGLRKSAMSRDAWVGAAVADIDRSIGADELVQRAHLAMDRSETEGRPMTFGPDDVVRERRRVSVRLRLPQAIESGAVRPAFQPQIDLATGRVVGCEVLARWDDHQIGAVTPVEFVEISEQSQQIELLTLSLLRQALELDLTEPSGRRIPLAVNLSARSLGNEPFVESLVAHVAAGGRSLAEFTFEVAESTVATDGIATIFGIDHLRSLGARVSIDDFGTGNSTLSYLDKLPIHEIKIDRTLTSTIGTFEAPNPVIRHLIGLCSDLGLDVVAEGVENPLQRDLSYELGCRRAQGYLFARPMAPNEAAEWIRTNASDPEPLVMTG